MQKLLPAGSSSSGTSASSPTVKRQSTNQSSCSSGSDAKTTAAGSSFSGTSASSATVKRQNSAPATSAWRRSPAKIRRPGSSLSKPGQEVSPGNRSHVQQYVTRVGLRLLYRFSDLVLIAERLEANGFTSKARFQCLDEASARELDIPQALADALQAEAAGPPEYRKLGSVTRLAEMEHGLEEQGPAPGVGPEIQRLAHRSASIPTFESTVEGIGLSHFFPGFPSALRDYEPKSPALPTRSLSPLRRPASPSEARALAAHVQRQTSAREHRCSSRDEMRISGSRRDRASDPWQASSFNHRSSSPVLGSSRNRSIVGMDSWQMIKEATRDISPTYVGQGTRAHEHRCDYGWSSESSTQIRQVGASLRLRLKSSSEQKGSPAPELEAVVYTPKSYSHARSGADPSLLPQQISSMGSIQTSWAELPSQAALESENEAVIYSPKSCSHARSGADPSLHSQQFSFMGLLQSSWAELQTQAALESENERPLSFGDPQEPTPEVGSPERQFSSVLLGPPDVDERPGPTVQPELEKVSLEWQPGSDTSHVDSVTDGVPVLMRQPSQSESMTDAATHVTQSSPMSRVRPSPILHARADIPKESVTPVQTLRPEFLAEREESYSAQSSQSLMCMSRPDSFGVFAVATPTPRTSKPLDQPAALKFTVPFARLSRASSSCELPCTSRAQASPSSISGSISVSSMPVTPSLLTRFSFSERVSLTATGSPMSSLAPESKFFPIVSDASSTRPPTPVTPTASQREAQTATACCGPGGMKPSDFWRAPKTSVADTSGRSGTAPCQSIP